jgi:hypothetical protein
VDTPKFHDLSRLFVPSVTPFVWVSCGGVSSFAPGFCFFASSVEVIPDRTFPRLVCYACTPHYDMPFRNRLRFFSIEEISGDNGDIVSPPKHNHSLVEQVGKGHLLPEPKN